MRNFAHKKQENFVDAIKKRCEELSEILKSTLVLNADGTNFDLLKNEDVEQSDVVVCVTNNDEKNLLCSLLAKQLGVEKIITRVSNETNVLLFENMHHKDR